MIFNFRLYLQEKLTAKFPKYAKKIFFWPIWPNLGAKHKNKCHWTNFFKKTNEWISSNNGFRRMHSHTDGQAWVYKTFSAKAGVPKKKNKINKTKTKKLTKNLMKVIGEKKLRALMILMLKLQKRPSFLPTYNWPLNFLTPLFN